jgi:hypothetical protein
MGLVQLRRRVRRRRAGREDCTAWAIVALVISSGLADIEAMRPNPARPAQLVPRALRSARLTLAEVPSADLSFSP